MFKYHEKGALNTLLKSIHSIITALGLFDYISLLYKS